MKPDGSSMTVLLVLSLFCGIIIIALGLGAEYTSVNKVMGPLICGREKLEVAWEYNVSHPGKAVLDGRWLCVDETAGTVQDASIKTILISGLVYGLLIFAAFMGRWKWVNQPA